MILSVFNTRTLLLVLVLSSFFFWSPSASAQSFGLGLPGINIELDPPHPEPNSFTIASLSDYTLNTIGADVHWYIDEVEQLEYQNKRIMSVYTHGFNTPTQVKVIVTQKGGISLSKTVTIHPTVVDIVLETDTYTPIFYKGKALPSSNSKIRAIALVHSGGNESRDEYSYKWSAGDTVIHGGPLTGGYIIDYQMPLFDNNDLSVEVFDKKGESIAKKTITLNLAEPELHFYEYNTLRGLSGHAIRDAYAFSAEETTLFAEPYNMNARVDTGGVDFSWYIDNAQVQSDKKVPNMLTLKRNGTGGNIGVSVRAVSKSYVQQLVTGNINLVY